MKTLMSGNWKMHKTIVEGVQFINELKQEIQNRSDRGILICVPFTMLASVAEAAKGSSIMIGAENMFYEEKGAFTGEISPLMLKDAGATHVLIGHSERRAFFNESDDVINKKIKSAITHGIVPVLCVGETLEERESGKLELVLKTQIDGAFKDISESDAKKVIIAYEPVWAIGTGKTASPQNADDAHKIVRNLVEALFGKNLSDKMLILYGGSVKADNVDELMAMPNIDGSLVGGASLEVASFARIVNYESK